MSSPAARVAEDLVGRVAPVAGRRVGHSDRPPLDDPRRCLLVVEGVVEVFARVAVDGDSWRIHLTTLERGDLGFGVDGHADGVVLEAVPADAVVADVDVGTLTAQDGLIDVAAPAIESWVEALGRAVAAGPPPRAALALTTGEAAAAGPGTAITASRFAWIESPNDGALWYLGQRPIAARVPVAVSSALWAEAHEATPVSAVATDRTIDLAAALSVHHALVTTLLAQRAAAESAADVRRIEQRGAEDSNTLAQATGVLASAARQETAENLLGVSAHPLLTAARLVGAAEGIEFPEPRGGAAALDAADEPLAALADAAGCEYRTIGLEGRWWTHLSGALLVFRDSDMAPMAVLPTGPGKADLVDPSTGARERLRGGDAAMLFETAVMFYPALPGAPTTLGQLLRLGAKGIRQDVTVALLMLLLVGTASIVTPMVVGEITGSVVQEGRVEQLGILIGALVVASMAAVGFTFVQSIAALRIEGLIDMRAQSALWIRLLQLPASFFRRFSVGDLAMRALGIDAMRRIMTTSALSSLLSLATGVFSLGVMFAYAWLLALCAVGLLLIYGSVMVVFLKRAARRQRDLLDQQGRVQALVLQLLQAVGKLRVTGSEARAFARWAEEYAHARRLALERQRISTVVPIANSLLAFAGLTAFVAVISVQADQFWGPDLETFSWATIDAATLARVIAPSDFLAFFTAYGQLFAAVASIVQVSMTLVGIAPLRDRLLPILEAETESREDGEDPGELNGTIEVSGIMFRYVPDMPLVLNGLDLAIEAGSFVAIVGPSGAGKSSLIRLLLGFDEPEAGSIFYDGKDLSVLDKRAVRRQCGVVLQNGRLMSGSIFDNIVAGSPLSEDDAWEAARMAGLDKDIEAMPMKMQTVVADGAGTISGGQRQRLMIARAIVRRPRILIFDEATSALDNETQKIVSDSLARLNCTRIAIAHRLSTVVNADRIFVLDHGRLVESGSYEELMALDGTFAKLARRQIA